MATQPSEPVLSRHITESPRQSLSEGVNPDETPAPTGMVHAGAEPYREDTLGSLDSRRASYPVPRRPQENQLQGEHRPWMHKNILSLDGGGIRGYYSLLILKQLMETIKLREKRFADGTGREAPAKSSFWPCEEPSNVSSILRESDDHEEPRVFLPCHYFDYICGTSTGGLIAIMLSRLRMTVDDCISEYRSLGGQVFGKPRHFHQLLPPLVWWNRTKYNARLLENAILNILDRRGETSEHPDRGRFESEDGVCRTFVFAYKKTSDKEKGKTSVEAPFIFRSYEHRSRAPKKNREVHPRNPGPASPYHIWEVARATTAAPFYFDPFITQGRPKISQPSTKKRTNSFPLTNRGSTSERESAIFIDGGFGAPNNPTLEAYYEVETSKAKIGTFTSIGTGRKVTDRFQTGIAKKLGAGYDVAGDSETVHESVQKLYESSKKSEQAKKEGKNFSYFRFNEPSALGDMSLDEWEPKSTGIKTLEKMENAIGKWLRSPEIQEEVQNCAEELVRRRRLRTKDFSKWERYALGSCFECRVNDDECNSPRSMFPSRAEFVDHLVRFHKVERSDTEKLKRLAKENRTGWNYTNPQSNGHF